MSKSDRQSFVAYHEAGHAGLTVQLGCRIGRHGVTIVPSGDIGGSVHGLRPFHGNPEVGTTDQTRLGAEKEAIILFAGTAAQRKFRPSSVRSRHGLLDRSLSYMFPDGIPEFLTNE